MKKKTIDKKFYTRLALFLVLIFIFIAILSLSIMCFCYVSGINNSLTKPDICDVSSPNYNSFYCAFKEGKDNGLYNIMFYGTLSLIIISSASILLLLTFYLSNHFYFRKIRREYSYGAVIYKVEDDKIFYLIELMSAGHNSLCKGHQEEGEVPFETALREIKEETSLDVELDTNFSTEIKYFPKKDIYKKVTFYVAEVTNLNQTPVDSHDEEVADFERKEFGDALMMLTYQLDRRVLKKANTYICKQKNIKK